MWLLVIIALSLLRIADAFSFSAYDIGFLGVYPTHKYESMNLQPPAVQITAWDERCESEGSVLLISPRGVSVPKPGPVILDTKGELIWMEETFGQAMNLQVQTYKGQDFITFWSGTSHGPHSNGSYYMLDSTYSEVHKVQAAGYDLNGDLHEFHITPQNTALITVYADTLLDCTSLGLPGKCWIDDCLFQEISISTGKLLFQWRASDHIPLSTSYKSLARDGDGSTPEKAYDFFHMNSIEKDATGNYVISSRHMHTIYCISPAGKILWTLGGRNSSFTDLSNGSASNFAWQHHARLHGNNTLSLFDNGGNNVFQKFHHSSRGMLLELNTENMTVKLLQAYTHPSQLLAISQGSMQVLPSTGNVLVGWGNTPAFTEFTPDGELVCDMHFGPWIIYSVLDFGWVKSYRAFKSKWVGLPTTNPDIKYAGGGQVYVSWNGATEVKKWLLQAAEKQDAADDDFIPLEVALKEEFETSFEMEGDMSGAWVRVVALDGDEKILGITAVVDTKTQLSSSIPVISIVVFTITVVAAGFLIWKYRSRLSERCIKTLDLVRMRKTPQQYELVETEESNENLLRHRDRDRDREDV